MAEPYLCGDEERRAAVALPESGLNGIDSLEVVDGEAPNAELRQRLLVVRFLKGPLPPLRAADVALEGGVRVRGIRVLWAFPLDEVTAAAPPEIDAAERLFLAAFRAGEPDRDRLLVVRTDAQGDFSAYRVTVAFPDDADPGLDERLDSIAFSFKVECPSEFDCAPVEDCPAEPPAEPRIDYLAKDYASFRRLLFDRLSVVAPRWSERNPADLGVAMVELMAYLGDHLSYTQDAVATESYLGTARRRISVRRHARLVDYRIDDGANARVWVRLEVNAAADGAVLPGPVRETGAPGTRLTTRFDPARVTLAPGRLDEALHAGAVIFETMHDVILRSGLGELPFYTWSDRECCLPAGATRATLATPPRPGLEPGAFLLFEEIVGPRTGNSADADPARRWVVRLTEAVPGEDRLNGTPVVEIAWDAADALPFPLCVSARADAEHGGGFLDRVSVARGNVVLADHGLSRVGDELEPVPEESRFFRPRLADAPLTHAAPLPPGFPGAEDPGERPAPASAVFADRRGTERPAVALIEPGAGEVWGPQPDLLASDRFAREFVAEIDDEGGARLRFGDGRHGRLPAAGTIFTPRYRVGQGAAGEIGPGSLAHVLSDQAGIVGVRNPLPAAGGREPERLEEVRRFAPQAFRRQQRAVTAEDYAVAAEAHPEVERAAATFRWTGSWYTVFVTVDRRGGLPVDAEFEARLRDHLNFYRMAGYDLELDGPRFVPLEIEARLCVEPDFFRSDVVGELLRVFSSRRSSDGRPGFFHPDLWTFAQPLFLSRFYAAAQAVAGIESIEVTTFKRWGRVAVAEELADGEMKMGRLEIARLDNDPNFPENGVLTFSAAGGR